MKSLLSGVCGVLAACGLTATLHAAPIPVGSGQNTAYVVFNLPGGHVVEYDVSFDGTINGYALTNIADVADADLSVQWSNFGTPETPNYFLNMASHNGHVGDASTTDFSVPTEDWWHQWIDVNGSWQWGFGASVTQFDDGGRLGWVFGTAAAPVPEPAAMGLLAGAALLMMRRRCHA